MSANLRTQLERIIRRAGLQPWPKLFHNLRSTRQTELAEKYPLHVVCQWIGNSRAIAQEHCLQVTHADFTEATKDPAEKAAQNPTQQLHAEGRNASQDENRKTKNPAICGAFQGSAAGCDDPNKYLLGDTRFELVTSCVSCMRSNQLS